MAVEAAAITAAEDNGNIRAQYCRCSRGLPRTDRTAAVLHHHVLADQNIVGKMGNMLERWVSMLSRWYKVHRGRGYTSPVRAGCWGALRDDGGQCAQSKSIAVKSSSPAVRGRPQLHMCIIIYVCRCRSRRRLLLLLLLPLYLYSSLTTPVIFQTPYMFSKQPQTNLVAPTISSSYHYYF